MPDRFLPYGRHEIDDEDVAQVAAVLRSDWLTTGPLVRQFEAAVTAATGARWAVAVTNGTAALHAAMAVVGVGPGDEVVVPALTFCATANAVLYQGGTPVFADVDPETLLVAARHIEPRLTARTKAIVAVDYAGQPCPYGELRALAAAHGVPLIADACHALGATYAGRAVGALADLSTLSFHPVKPMTTGEGGMLLGFDPSQETAARRFRNHGIATDHRERALAGTFAYEMLSLGYNYRLTDIQCALGLSQLRRLGGWIARRQAIAARYDAGFHGAELLTPLARVPSATHGYHLYVVRLAIERLRVDRGEVFRRLRDRGVGVNVHYLPVHLHPYYRDRLGTAPGLCPAAEAAYERILSLPVYPGMTDEDTDRVVAATLSVLEEVRAP